MTHMTIGTGITRITVDEQGVHIEANGQRFDSNDTKGPYNVKYDNGAFTQTVYTQKDEAVYEGLKGVLRLTEVLIESGLSRD